MASVNSPLGEQTLHIGLTTLARSPEHPVTIESTYTIDGQVHEVVLTLTTPRKRVVGFQPPAPARRRRRK